jgi:lipopolysaccharide/colanic/teichoic acid biosynthesis glycosyltransferase
MRDMEHWPKANEAVTAARSPRAGDRLGVMLIIALVGASLIVLPALYGLAAFHGDFGRMRAPRILGHVACECLANVAVMLGSLGLAGRLDRKLAQVFGLVLSIHGALALMILFFRLYYSIPMLLAGVVCSAFLGPLAMFIRHRTRPLRVGVLGPEHSVLSDRNLDWEMIDTADDAIGAYDLLLVTDENGLPPQWSRTVSRAMLAGRRVRHVAEYLEEARGIVSIAHFDLDHLPRGGLASYATVKRVMDIFIVICALPIAAPILALSALAVRLTMGAPVLFIQERVGLGGRVFRMIKLRTMRSRRTGDPAVATARGDERVTPAGRLLRRYHLDELPQIWNVLKGEMSIVGPRPEQPALGEAYGREVPAFVFRHLVRPGITGWAQVRAPYAADLAETQIKLGFDLFYLKNFSLALDVQIMARTFWTLIIAFGVR